MTEQETAQLIGVIKAAFPRQPIGSATVAIYMDLLADLSVGEAQAAVKSVLSHSEFFPTIAAIRTAVAAGRVNLPAAETEWRNVIKAVGEQGRYRVPKFDNPATVEAVRCIGWDAICNSEMIGVERAHFLRAYEAVVAREMHAANVGALEGRPYHRLELAPEGEESIDEAVIRALRKTPDGNLS